MASRTSTGRRVVRVLRLVLAVLFSALAVIVLPVEAWGVTLPSAGMAGITPSYAGKFANGTWAHGSYSGTWWLENAAGPTVTVGFTASSGATGFSVYWEPRCGSTWKGASAFSTAVWQGDPANNAAGWTSSLSLTSTGLCSSSGEVTAVRFLTGSTFATATLRQELVVSAPSVATTCPTQYVGLRASYVGGVLSVRFRWSGTAPATGWKVYVPGDGTTTAAATPVASVTRSRATGVADYGSDTTVTLSGVVAGVTSLRVSSAESFGCYGTSVVQGSAVADTVADQGSVNGEACSTWDLFCQIRSAFTPSQSSLDQWSSLGATASEVVPLGYVLDSVTLLGYLDDGCGAGADCSQLSSGFCFDPAIGGPDVAGPLGSGICPLAPSSPVVVWLRGHRDLMGTLAWASVLIPLVAFVWRKSVPFINGGS